MTGGAAEAADATEQLFGVDGLAEEVGDAGGSPDEPEAGEQHDREARELSPEQCQALRVLASQVVAQLELRRRRRQEIERSGEKLLLEVAGLAEAAPALDAEPAHG